MEPFAVLLVFMVKTVYLNALLAVPSVNLMLLALNAKAVTMDTCVLTNVRSVVVKENAISGPVNVHKIVRQGFMGCFVVHFIHLRVAVR